MFWFILEKSQDDTRYIWRERKACLICCSFFAGTRKYFLCICENAKNKYRQGP